MSISPKLTTFPKLASSRSSTGVAPDENAVLVVQNVWKKFGQRQALAGASFSLKPAERLLLLGPNGAGKTTLIRMIGGRLRADEGEIRILRKSNLQHNALQNLGIVPQDLAIYSDLSARQNLECFAQLHGLRGQKMRDRVDWALDWIGLTDRANELTGRYSGGMKRRVNIACGVLHAPSVLLLDEPTVGVDPQSRQRIFEMLDELNRAGTSILLTTHNIDEAQLQSDRVVILDHGVIVADGTVNQLIPSTIGTRKRVFIEAAGTMVAAPPGLVWDPRRRRFVCQVENIVDELPEILDRIKRVGATVLDLEIQQPNLHQVFLHLTGKELRE